MRRKAAWKSRLIDRTPSAGRRSSRLGQVDPLEREPAKSPKWIFVVLCWVVLGLSPCASDAKDNGTAHFDRAVTAAQSGRTDEALASLERAFASGYPTPSAVLTHAAFAPVRSDPVRRSRLNHLLRNHARESRITMVAPGTPGIPLRFVARVQDARTRAPVPRAFIYLYHTDHLGYYDRDSKGVARARERASLRSRAH